MTSVEINGNILNKLCQEMNNLQSDSEIELWRIEDNKKFTNASKSPEDVWGYDCQP